MNQPLFSAAVTSAAIAVLAAAVPLAPAQAQEKRPNIVMLMTDDTGWNDFGAYSGGGAALGHPTPNVDHIAKEGVVFTNCCGQARLHGGPGFVRKRAHPDPHRALHRHRRQDCQNGNACRRGPSPS